MTNTGHLALHGLSLCGVVALGAGLWTLSQKTLPPPPSPGAVQVPAPKLESDLRRLRNDVAVLQSQVAALRQERDDLKTRFAQAPAALPPPADRPSVAVLQATLDDPRMRETIQAVVDSRLKADREEQAKQHEQDLERRAAQRDQQRLDRFAQEAGLNDTQKNYLGQVSTDYRDKLNQLRAQLREQIHQKTLTADQVKTTLDLVFTEMDAKTQAVLTADQMKQYQDMQRRTEDQTLRWITGQGRRGKQSPTP